MFASSLGGNGVADFVFGVPFAAALVANLTGRYRPVATVSNIKSLFSVIRDVGSEN
jgi:hypothetical protein